MSLKIFNFYFREIQNDAEEVGKNEKNEEKKRDHE